MNALPDEWGNFVSSIYGKKEATPFNELWSFCKIKENIFKAKSNVGSNEQVQTYASMARIKGKFDPRKKKKIDMSKIKCYECNEYGHFKRNCPKLKKENKKKNKIKQAHDTEEVEESEKKKSKEEEVKDHYFD